jgi:glycine cleavage system aminomethyltransferase T
MLEGCGGNPKKVREKLMAEAPKGVNIRSIRWQRGQDVARITVEGPNSEQFLTDLEARDVVELVSSGEHEEDQSAS